MNQLYSKNSNSLNGVIKVPGDKSISQRILILGSLAIGTTKIKGISYSEDANNLIENLKSSTQNFHIYTFGGLTETNKWLSENNYA